MKIVFVLPGYFRFPIGGYAVAYHYANQMVARGHAVEIVFAQRFAPVAEREPPWRRAKQKLWPVSTRLRNWPLVPWFELDPRVRLRPVHDWHDGLLRGADIAVATAWETAAAVARAVPATGRGFYLIQHHEIWSGPADAVNATFGLDLHFVAISPWLVEVARRFGGRDVSYIPNGLDHDRFRVTAPLDRRPSLLSLYHHAAFKGVPDALHVLGRVHADFPDVPVRMFGVPARGKEMPDWIEYVRDPAPDRLVALYNEASIYLGASLAEGWALPPAEAMACGCLFIGTDIGGFRDYATDGETALLSPAGDRDAMYANVRRALLEPALAARIRDAGIRRVAGFTWPRSGEAMLRLFEDRLAR